MASTSNPPETAEDRSHLEMNAPFAIGEESIKGIVELAHQISAKRVLEFGSGRSTARLALELPNALITSLEHDPNYADQTERRLVEFGVAERVVLVRSALGWWRYANRIFYTYVAPIPAAPYDLVLVDGPPGYLHTGRQGALHKVFGMLPIGARVVLDDFDERREQRALERWLRDYPGSFAWREVNVGHRLLVIEKTDDRPIRPATLAILASNLLDNGRGLFRRAAHRSVHLIRRSLRSRDRAQQPSSLH
jgi:predicted O-methyltransferase YrrM